jgi:hypothetical protein
MHSGRSRPWLLEVQDYKSDGIMIKFFVVAALFLTSQSVRT